MRISWLSNAPWARTGYGNQTLLFAPRIQGLGHDIQITAFYGVEGGILQWGGPNGPIPVYPRGYHPYGLDVMSAHAQTFEADILISLIDAWVIDPNLVIGQAKWCPWFPVDHDRIPDAVLNAIRPAWARIVYSQYAEKLVKEAGLDCYYVPHGVDTNIYHPIERTKVREDLRLPEDKFIVGIVAANKGNPSRKAWPEHIAAFAELKRRHSDVFFYLHTVSGEQNDGPDLIKLCEIYDLKTGFMGRCDPRDVDVLFCDQYKAMIGIDESYLNAMYNAMDVFVLASTGEGFGIPIIEAQAAGCPVIVGDWTSMPELVFSGWKIPKSETHPFYTPFNAFEYLPRIGAIVDYLEKAYQTKDVQKYRDRARKGVMKYDADKITEKYWRPVLADMEERIEAWKPPDKANYANNWGEVGLFNPDGSMDVPDRSSGDALRVFPDGKRQIIRNGFKNPLNLKWCDPDGLEWLLMREFERDYKIADIPLTEDSIVVDIGAHVGVVAISIAKKFKCHVIAFEPDQDNYRRLMENIQINDVGAFVEARNSAVTSDGRKVKIGGGGGNSGGRNIYQSDGSGHEIGSTTLKAIVEEIDATSDRDIDLLKIDCEGAEYEILKNADNETMKKIKRIRGEFHGPKAPAFLNQIRIIVPDTHVTFQGLNE